MTGTDGLILRRPSKSFVFFFSDHISDRKAKITNVLDDFPLPCFSLASILREVSKNFFLATPVMNQEHFELEE